MISRGYSLFLEVRPENLAPEGPYALMRFHREGEKDPFILQVKCDYRIGQCAEDALIESMNRAIAEFREAKHCGFPIGMRSRSPNEPVEDKEPGK